MPLYSDLANLQCPACSKFFSTTRGRDSHLLQAKSCKWFCQGKLREDLLKDDQDNAPADLDVFDAEEQTQLHQGGEAPMQWQEDLDFSWDNSNWPDPSDDEGGGDMVVTAEEDLNRDEFCFLQAQAGPGPQTQENRSTSRPSHSWALDDEDDSRLVVEHPSAGSILLRIRDSDGDIAIEDTEVVDQAEASKFSPFNSELDWQIAEWVVKDNIGHNSFDRLLGIPGVRVCFGLDFFVD